MAAKKVKFAILSVHQKLESKYFKSTLSKEINRQGKKRERERERGREREKERERGRERKKKEKYINKKDKKSKGKIEHEYRNIENISIMYLSL